MLPRAATPTVLVGQIGFRRAPGSPSFVAVTVTTPGVVSIRRQHDRRAGRVVGVAAATIWATSGTTTCWADGGGAGDIDEQLQRRGVEEEGSCRWRCGWAAR
ncbi:MAG: hypothetical protein R2694_09390 [Ilumatobacteraceae bacterium]